MFRNQNNSVSNDAYVNTGPRYSIRAIGARAALDHLTKHANAITSGTEDFIPATPEGEYRITAALSAGPRGQSGMWECGGSMGNYGGVNLFAGPDARPLNPLLTHHANPEHSCDKHVLLPVMESYLMAHAAHGGGNVLITAWRAEELTFDPGDNPERGGVTRATFKLIYASDGIDHQPIFVAEEEEAFVEDDLFLAFLKAAWTKVNMFNCKTSVWSYPWAPWIVTRGGKDWELPEAAAEDEKIIEAIAGVGMTDPDPKTVCTDYNAMVGQIEKMAADTIYKFRNASSAKRGPRAHALQYFTMEQTGKVRITTFLLLSNVKTPKIVGTFVYFADPNTTPQSERQEAAYYFNNRKPLYWDALKKKFGDESTGGVVRLVCEYTGC